ncbi:MAG: hypothetical protein KGV50_02650 [Gammaproteobacteria bacterium]|nr:hypothetical protein [Gammaproteobacteria bacterium]
MKNINLQLEDEETYATVGYHVPVGIYINLNSQSVSIDTDGYVVKKAWERKRRHIMRNTYVFNFNGDAPTYDEIINKLITDEDSPLFGGVVDKVNAEVETQGNHP